MEKISYESLLDLTDPVYAAALEGYSELYGRRRKMDELHARPPLREIASDPSLRAAWVGQNAPAKMARNAAMGLLDAESDAQHARLCATLAGIYAANGWTAKEVNEETDRRVGLAGKLRS